MVRATLVMEQRTGYLIYYRNIRRCVDLSAYMQATWILNKIPC